MKIRMTLVAGLILVTAMLPASEARAVEDVDTLVPTRTWSPTCVNQTQSTSTVVCQTDNASLVYYMQSSLSTGSRTSVHLTQNNSYDGTHLTVSETTSPVYSGTGETDIIYQEGTTGFTGTTIGIYWCNDAVNSEIYECDQGYVKFKYAADRQLACHETGHAVGLVHGAQAYLPQSNQASLLGCMVTPADPNQQYLGDVNVANINGVY